MKSYLSLAAALVGATATSFLCHIYLPPHLQMSRTSQHSGHVIRKEVTPPGHVDIVLPLTMPDGHVVQNFVRFTEPQRQRLVLEPRDSSDRPLPIQTINVTQRAWERYIVGEWALVREDDLDRTPTIKSNVPDHQP